MAINNTTGHAGAPFEAYLSAYLQGREAAKQRRRGATLSALAPLDAVRDGGNDRARDNAWHVPVHHLLQRLPREVRETARAHADILFAFVQGLAHYPYSARPDILKHSAPHLRQLGFTDEELAGFDPTDSNLEEIAGAARHVLAGGGRPWPQQGPTPTGEM